MKIVKVTWTDSVVFSEQKDILGDDLSPGELETVGFLIRDEKEHIALAMELIEQENVRLVVSIPRTCIKSIKILEK